MYIEPAIPTLRLVTGKQNQVGFFALKAKLYTYFQFG